MSQITEITSDFKLDGENRVPYYYQLKQLIIKMIESEKWQKGQMLPYENQICGQLSISRIVVRQAFQELKNEGYIISRKGKGSFVAEPKINENWIQSFMGFNENMTKLGYKVVNTVLSQEKIIAPDKVLEALKLNVEKEVILIRRVHNINDEPFYLSTNYFPYKMFPALLTEDLTHGSLYKVLESKYGIEITHCRRYIGMSFASREEAKLLNIKKSEPLFQVESISYLKGDIPFEYFTSLHLGGRSRFVVELIKTESFGKGSKVSLDSISSGIFIKPHKLVSSAGHTRK